MILEKARRIKIGAKLTVNALTVMVIGKLYERHGQWFFPTDYGDFNIDLCEVAQ